MSVVHTFTFNPFQENTYILSDETQECVIIDPGCYEKHEQEELAEYINSNDLKPVQLLNTHCHIDHVLGNKYVSEKYKLGITMHQSDLTVLNSLMTVANMYGIPNVQESPAPKHFIDEGDQITFGNTVLDVIFVPGHAPGHVAFVSHADRYVINGDVLFQNSIGRTDLPGGDFDTLISSIREKMFTLDEDYVVYTGHGPATTIGHEKANNPFLK